MDGTTRDVRMRGFRERSNVEAVLQLIEERVHALSGESVQVGDSVGRILVVEQSSPTDVPGFDRSAMDGYALKAEETFGATVMTPLAFRVLGEARPGHPFNGTVEPGSAVRIMTGAPLPAGADAVLMAEKVEGQGATVFAKDAVAPGKHVGRRGEDIRQGTSLLPAGRHIRPQDAGLLASAGLASVEVVRQPKVTILITGDELLPPGSKPEPPHIVDSNSLILKSLVIRDGGLPDPQPILKDHRELVREALSRASGDLILISGGSSVGSEDHAPTLLAELGQLLVHGVALRPASPAGMGLIQDRPVFLIPGNPVSCLAAYEFFAGPAIRRLGGRSMEWPHRRIRLPLLHKIASAIGRVDYVRVSITDQQVEPLAISGASILSSTTRADGAVLVPRQSEGFAPGETVEVLLY